MEEEAGIAITDPEYMGSFVIDDWRYRGERDVIKTLLFRARLLSGSAESGRRHQRRQMVRGRRGRSRA